jgi:hypothetical protein
MSKSLIFFDWYEPEPENTKCKHGRETCEKCGTNNSRDALHRTKGGKGVVGQM